MPNPRRVIVCSIAVILFSAVECFCAYKFGQHELERVATSNRPNVTFTRPADGEKNVLPTIYISCDLNLPNKGAGVNAGSLFNGALKLVRTRDKQPVPMQFNTSGGGDSIVATPNDLLEANTQYTFEITDGVKDTSGSRFMPFSLSFTTAAGEPSADYPVAFEKIALEATNMTTDPKRPTVYTGLTIGPDRKLYAATFDGRIVRFAINDDGTLGQPQPIMTMFGANHGPRLITGIAFDPAATAENPILWVSHGQMVWQNADDWTGKISVLRGANLEQYQDIITGLPRAYRDHLNFQPTFGSDGALYFCQGSMTSVGGPDKKWNLRREHLLSAACLRLDPKLVTSPPLNVQTEGDDGKYDPAAPNAPLTIYATGIRSGFDLLWHRNGHLYTGLNGAAAGGNVPSGPTSPAIKNIAETTNDLLLDLVKGAYYGHPNEKRHEFILMGGNPTKNEDPQEITEYPVGTQPEKSFTPPVYDFGKSVSPNGMCEYVGGPLDGRILVTRYSGGKDIVALTPDKNGKITEAVVGIDGFRQFSDPLDIVQDTKTGNLYVAEYAGKQLTLLKPKVGAVSKRVFKQAVNDQ